MNSVWEVVMVGTVEAPLIREHVFGEANQSEHVPKRSTLRSIPLRLIMVSWSPFRVDSNESTEERVHYFAVEDRVDAVSPPLESHIARLVEVVLGILRSTSATTGEQAPEGVSPAHAVTRPPRNGLRAPSLAGTSGGAGCGG